MNVPVAVSILMAKMDEKVDEVNAPFQLKKVLLAYHVNLFFCLNLKKEFKYFGEVVVFTDGRWIFVPTFLSLFVENVFL